MYPDRYRLAELTAYVLGLLERRREGFPEWNAETEAKLAALGRKQVVVAGYETHICVCQTALDAVAAGYQVHLVRDATSSRTKESAAVGVEKMAAAGVVPATAETVLFEWLGRAGTDEFRALLPVIKR